MSDPYRTTDLSLFVFEGTHPVRMWLDADNDLEAVAADLAAVLGLVNIHTSLESFPANEKGLRSVDTPGGLQHMLTVRKGGFYRLIFQSRKPIAERLRSWVFNEVLTQLRRTGTYALPGARPPRQHIDAPKEFTVAQILCFWEVHTHPQIWFTTDTLAQAAQISVRRVRDYCRYFADIGLFERVHWHPSKQYRWHPNAIDDVPALVQAYTHAYAMLPKDLPVRVPIWEKESDPRKW